MVRIWIVVGSLGLLGTGAVSEEDEVVEEHTWFVEKESHQLDSYNIT